MYTYTLNNILLIPAVVVVVPGPFPTVHGWLCGTQWLLPNHLVIKKLESTFRNGENLANYSSRLHFLHYFLFSFINFSSRWDHWHTLSVFKALLQVIHVLIPIYTEVKLLEDKRYSLVSVSKMVSLGIMLNVKIVSQQESIGQNDISNSFALRSIIFSPEYDSIFLEN